MASWLFRLGLLRSVFADVKLALRLARDRRVTWLVKTLPLLALLYTVSPLDIVPDLLPGLGQVDDVGVIVLALKLFLRLCPAAVVAFHRDEMLQGRPYSSPRPGDDIIDAEFRQG
jgi:uncharacterized membrane protein YkvA (DUF1232 family)